MRLIAALLTFLLALAPVSAGQMSLLGAGKPAAASAPTTWNSADKDASVSLDATFLIATGGFGCVRSIASHSTGKYFASSFVNPISGGNTYGIANSSFVLSGSVPNSTNSAGAFPEGGSISFNSGVIGTFTAAVTNDIVDMAVDIGAQLIWFRTNGGDWNGNPANNPATGTGGASFAGIGAGPYFATICLNSGRVGTANFGASAYSFAAPSGFGNW